MQAVLTSLQSDSGLEQQLADATLAWNAAQADITRLESENAQLGQRLQAAQQAAEGMRKSAAQEWTGRQGGWRHV